MSSFLKKPDKNPFKERLVEGEDGRLLTHSPMAYVYLLLPVVFLFLFLIYPTIKTARMAFYERFVFITSTGTGFGLSAFRYVLNDPTFWQALKNTAILLLVALPLSVILALVFALLINSIKKFQGVLSDAVLPPLRYLHHCHRHRVFVAVPLPVRLYHMVPESPWSDRQGLADRQEPGDLDPVLLLHLERSGL